jgi:hypothetical protein
MKDKEKKGKLSVVQSGDEDVVELYPSAETVLKSFLGTNPMQILVISLEKEGMLRSGSNTIQKGDLLFMVEQFRHSLMSGEFDD